MKIAKLDITPIYVERQDIIDNYYPVEDNYNFSGNSATDVTSYQTLSIFAGVGRYNYRIFRESLIDNIVPVFSGLTTTDKKSMVYNRAYPSGYTDGDLIAIVGVDGLATVNRTISESELNVEDIAAYNTIITGYTGTTAPNMFVGKPTFSSFTALTVTYTDFDPYSASTESRLVVVESEIQNAFYPYTASTELRLAGIEADIVYISGQTGGGSGKLDTSVFTGYTATTETRLIGIENDIDYVSGVTNSKLNTSAFNTYSGATLTNINSRVLKTVFSTYTGTTAPATYQTKSSINTYTGTTAPATFQSKSSIVTLTGTTLPATFQSKSSIVVLTGTTLPNTYAAKTAFLLFTGTTAPATYQTKSSINTLTGTTLPTTYQTKASIVTLTGTTLPNTYAAKGAFLLYTGTTAPAIYLTKSVFNTYTGSTSGGVIYTLEDSTTRNNATDTFVTATTLTQSVSSGNYKITYVTMWGCSASSQNNVFEFRIDNVHQYPQQSLQRLSNNTEIRNMTMVKYKTLSAGSHTFSICFRRAGGTVTSTMYYTLILVEKVA